MSTRNRTPPLLEPYLRLPPEASQLLLTGVLDSSPQWLVTRLLRSAFLPTEESETTEEQHVSVILVSWLRDWEFWKSEARRGAGVDLARLAQQDKFVFVDGLTNLFPVATTDAFAPPPPSAAPTPSAQTTLPVRNTPISSPLPNRGGPLPSRTPIPSRAPPTTPMQPQPRPPTQQPPQPQSTQPTTTTHLSSPSLPSTLTHLTKTISTIRSLHPTKKLHLILDSPTTLLSTSPYPSASNLSSLLLSLRSLVSSTTLILESDSPFLDAARPDPPLMSTPLEAAHAAFVVQQAHLSQWVVSLRPLDTGKARDVSGVVRVCRGGAWDQAHETEKVEDKKELEALYFVQNDGGVRVFERGEASVG